MGERKNSLYCMHIHDILVCMVHLSKWCIYVCVIKYTIYGVHVHLAMVQQNEQVHEQVEELLYLKKCIVI